MGINNEVTDKTGETAAESQGSGKSTGFESAKNTIADKLHGFAEALGKKTADTQSGIVHTGKRASELLDRSAEYVRQFDYHQTDTRVREYVKQSPGSSLLIAGAVGLIIGAILKRR
jgi:hypothetical protein